MNALSLFAMVAAAHALAVASPGPDFALVVRNSLAFGRRGGIWTAAGIGNGIILHVAYGLFGLGLIIKVFPGFLHWLTWAGALVLIYLGQAALRARPTNTQSDAAVQAPSARRCYLQGLLTNATNVKAMLFFVALFSAVIAQSSSMALKVALSLWLPLTTFAWFSLLTMLLTHANVTRWLHRRAHWIERGMGVILIGLALAMLAEQLGKC